MLEASPLAPFAATAESLADTSFYQVALKCPAAPVIACGSGSKPVLTDLESAAEVAGVWLNRSGTVLAIQLLPTTPSPQRQAVVDQVFALTATVGSPLEQPPLEAVESVGDPKAWYTSARLDKLTQEEAGIIAHRLLHRMETRAALSHEQQSTFLELFTRSFVRHFAVSTAALRTVSGAARVAELNEEVLHDSLPNFAGSQRVALEQALNAGYVPVPGDIDYSDAPVADCCTIEGL